MELARSHPERLRDRAAEEAREILAPAEDARPRLEQDREHEVVEWQPPAGDLELDAAAIVRANPQRTARRIAPWRIGDVLELTTLTGDEQVEIVQRHVHEPLHGLPPLRGKGGLPRYRTYVRKTRVGGGARVARCGVLVDSARVQTVGIVSPGAMGSAVADALARGGARVADRGGTERAHGAPREEGSDPVAPDLDCVVATADVVLSIVPPEAAERVAEDLAARASAASAQPLVVDLNAIAPETSRRLAEVIRGAGCDYVDGSISGPPPWKPEATRIYLSGDRASDIAALPLTGVERIVVGAEIGSASAVKMSTASEYKGTSALLAYALLAAHANGVLAHVLDDLRAGSPELVANAPRRLATAAAKSARYVAEMREIAQAQSAAGLTPALFEGMAEVYGALSETPLARLSPEDVSADGTLTDVLRGLR